MLLLIQKNIERSIPTRSWGWAALFVTALYALAVFQDYIEAKLKLFQFYWSESLLYNTYLFFFIPLLFAGIILSERHTSKKLLVSVGILLLFGAVCTFVHIYLFAGVFIWASELLYPIPHRFETILKSAISSYTYPTLFLYVLTPLAFRYLKKTKAAVQAVPSKAYSKVLTVRQGIRIITLQTQTIEAVTANRPYSEIAVADKTYLHNASLKTLMETLDPTVFIRVHRSALVNKHHIVLLHSRKNGDYDAVLRNGKTVRFSRHYRQNWHSLIPH